MLTTNHTVQTVHKPNNRSLAFDAERIMRYGERIMGAYPELDRERWHRASWPSFVTAMFRHPTSRRLAS